MSGRTFARAKAVVVAAEQEPAPYGHLVQAVDRTGRVDGVYRRLRVQRQAEALAAQPPPLPEGPFQVLVVDPPWPYTHRPGDDSKRNVTPYPAVTLAEIQALPVADLAAEDAVVWIRTTNAHLPDAFTAAAAEGLTDKTTLTWCKDRPGTGEWRRGQTEHRLLYVRGRPLVTLAGQSTALHAPRGRHSKEPEEFYALVEGLCPGSRLERFARRTRPGWVTHGRGLAVADPGQDRGESRRGRRAGRPPKGPPHSSQAGVSSWDCKRLFFLCLPPRGGPTMGLLTALSHGRLPYPSSSTPALKTS
jgi:N6-adenosine-specific RNA methylase IME4